MSRGAPTAIDPRSPTYQANRHGMLALLDEVHQAQDALLAGGGERYVARHRERGRLLVRERIDLLIDRGSPFLELSPLAGWGTDDPLGGGLVTGIGLVEGVTCVISANDPTVKGGASSPTTVAKGLRAQEVALRNRLPLINLTESAGADLTRQAEIFVPGGATFKDLTQLSAAGVPTITLVFGSSTAGGAYVPGMSDYTVLVAGQAKVFLGGPPLVKMAIDEDADEEELGGADMHARRSGLADHLAADEPDALRLGRMLVRDLRWTTAGLGRRRHRAPPELDPEELLGVASPDVRVPFEVREVLWRVLDGSVLDEFKPLYGSQLVCGWASLCGYPVGVLANNGILFSEEAEKGAHFIQLCNRRDLPAAVRAEHHRLHGGDPLRAGRHHQARQPAHQRRVELDGAPPDAHGGRLLRRGELRHVGPGLRPPLRLLLAQPPHRGHGAPTARRRALDRAAGQRAERAGRSLRRGGRRAPCARRSRARSTPSRPRSTPPAACGTTASSTPATPGPCSASPWPPPTRHRSRAPPASGCSGCERSPTPDPHGAGRQPGRDRPPGRS